MLFKGYNFGTQSICECVMSFKASALCSWHGMSQQTHALEGYPGHSGEPWYPLPMFLGRWQPAHPSPAQSQAIPDSSKPFQSQTIWLHRTRPVPALQMFHRGKQGHKWRILEAGTAVERHCVHFLLDTSVMTSQSQWPVVRLLPQSLFTSPSILQPPTPCTANTDTCAQDTAQFPWVSRATETTIKRSILGWDVIWWADLPTPP